MNSNSIKSSYSLIMSKKRICLLSGGCSDEREVSVSSADAVYEALDKDKYKILRYDARDDLQKFINDIFGTNILYMVKRH